jgi:hypothetical protein
MNQQINAEGKAGSWRSSGTSGQRYEIFLPLLLLTLALVGWFGFQTVELIRERSLLKQIHTRQEAQVQQSAKLRKALDGLAGDTARLAEAGNANARLLVDELRKRNITINPNAAPVK